MQNHYNLVYREEEREMIPLCIDQGVGVIPWSPLARGFLAGNRKRGRYGRDAARRNRRHCATTCIYSEIGLRGRRGGGRVARERGVTPAQIACAWVLQAPGVTAPIIGATKLNTQGTDRLGRFQAERKEEVAALEKPYEPHPVLGFEPPRPAKMLN